MSSLAAQQVLKEVGTLTFGVSPEQEGDHLAIFSLRSPLNGDGIDGILASARESLLRALKDDNELLPFLREEGFLQKLALVVDACVRLERSDEQLTKNKTIFMRTLIMELHENEEAARVFAERYNNLITGRSFSGIMAMAMLLEVLELEDTLKENPRTDPGFLRGVQFATNFMLWHVNKKYGSRLDGKRKSEKNLIDRAYTSEEKTRVIGAYNACRPAHRKNAPAYREVMQQLPDLELSEGAVRHIVSPRGRANRAHDRARANHKQR